MNPLMLSAFRHRTAPHPQVDLDTTYVQMTGVFYPHLFSSPQCSSNGTGQPRPRTSQLTSTADLQTGYTAAKLMPHFALARNVDGRTLLYHNMQTEPPTDKHPPPPPQGSIPVHSQPRGREQGASAIPAVMPLIKVAWRARHFCRLPVSTYISCPRVHASFRSRWRIRGDEYWRPELVCRRAVLRGKKSCLLQVKGQGGGRTRPNGPLFYRQMILDNLLSSRATIHTC